MLKLKGGREGGQSERIDPTEVKEIEGGAFSDDIRKIAMPLPFNQPSEVLFRLLGFLVDAGKGVVRTTLEDIADNQGNMPVGTQLAHRLPAARLRAVFAVFLLVVGSLLLARA